MEAGRGRLSNVANSICLPCAQLPVQLKLPRLIFRTQNSGFLSPGCGLIRSKLAINIEITELSVLSLR